MLCKIGFNFCISTLIKLMMSVNQIVVIERKARSYRIHAFRKHGSKADKYATTRFSRHESPRNNNGTLPRRRLVDRGTDTIGLVTVRYDGGSTAHNAIF